MLAGDLGIRDFCSLHHSICRSKAFGPKFLSQCGHFSWTVSLAWADACGKPLFPGPSLMPLACWTAITNSRCFSFHVDCDFLTADFSVFFGIIGRNSAKSWFLCFDESKVFLFLFAFFSQILMCFWSDSDLNVLLQIVHGNSISGTSSEIKTHNKSQSTNLIIYLLTGSL